MGPAMDPTSRRPRQAHQTAVDQDAVELPPPMPQPLSHWSETMTNCTGLWLEMQWQGRRERTEILEILDMADGRRALLAIVNTRRPDIRMAWVVWDPDRMGLVNRWERGTPSPAEAVRCNGDVHPIAVGEMTDCFTGNFTTFPPYRAVEVRAGGRWHPGRLTAFHHGPEGRAVASVMTLFYEPEWETHVAYKRLYQWDPATIRAASGSGIITPPHSDRGERS